ncbi:MAG TPA: DUF503 domain-containing protein [Gemmatimonadales bacterium]|nr:DUF503 domain-containing protein [Gemmatimonadales bacterium]
MVVGVARWELFLAGSQSLKDKRRVVKSLKDRLQARYGVSAAEVDHQDLWQRASLAAAVVSGEPSHVEQVLAACDRLVQSEAGATVVAVERRLI